MAWPDLQLVLAHTFVQRLCGLWLHPPLALNQGLCLMPCNAIHTVGMRHAIDVVFLDARGQLRKRVDGLAPMRWAVCNKARYAVELAAGYCCRHPDHADRIRQALKGALAQHRRWDDWRQIP
ncbi:MAG TPA: DUF192 domain-containing protein [Burkholderiaceae bacterium]|nr:DUF192 domain-containing protein [Burkholderiaceae bacterium]